MSEPEIGRIEVVSARSVFGREDTGFSTWLVKEENLNLLGDVLGMSLELPETEEPVGERGMRADILATNSDTGEGVVIENQYGQSDHAHLGKLLTYAAGLKSREVVWVAEDFKEEHVDTLVWLNEIGQKVGVRFHGVEFELLKIGNSLPAPMFHLLVGVPLRAREELAPTETDRALHGFWEGFHKYMRGKYPELKLSETKNRTNKVAVLGNKPGFTFGALAAIWEKGAPKKGPVIRVEFRIGDDVNYRSLEEDKDSIHEEFGHDLEWYVRDNTRLIRVRQWVDWREETKRTECYRWMADNLSKLQKVFSSRIKDL